ncbi:hypothetical protein QVD17_00322 [Tagetes erecta]|uniref:Uncharacterized protein n=1 Tax=Tagetes erecta TaxID=13708 RepID=A0AAD8LBD3_TARER|nr:hypothetical protein QVD17_00322 [Tagetes erecta]
MGALIGYLVGEKDVRRGDVFLVFLVRHIPCMSPHTTLLSLLENEPRSGIDEDDDEEGDEVETEVEKLKKKRKTREQWTFITKFESYIREKRTKGKEKVFREEEPEIIGPPKKKKKKDVHASLDEDAICGLNTPLANEFGMVKTKLMNLETRENH